MQTKNADPIRNRLTQSLMGDLPADVYTNVRIEMIASVAYGIFFAAAVSFLPVVLRRMGASSGLLALYIVQTYLGSVLASVSIVIMRRRRTMSFTVACWVVARGLFLLVFFIAQAHWLLVLTAFFWLLETFPSPAYARIVQHIYPAEYRGRVMAVVRIGMVAAVLVVTPLAGWALDRVGYRLLFPLAGLVGILASLMFSRMRVHEGELPPRQTRPLSSLWRILGQDRRFAIHLLGFSLYGLGMLMGSPLYPIVQVDQLDLSYAQIGYLGFVQSVFWLLSFLVWGRLIDQRSGIWVLRLNVGMGMLVPFTYIWATTGWMLLPAFIAHGIVMAGVDLGLISAGIELADPDQVVEYAALQATVIGIRGMIAPVLGAALVGLGVPNTAIFALGSGLVVAAWLTFGQVKVRTPVGAPALRRWPIRARNPRI